MYLEKTIAVVIPAYNEATQISNVIETMPAFVDHIVIVDDASTDETTGMVDSISKKNKVPHTNLLVN